MAWTSFDAACCVPCLSCSCSECMHSHCYHSYLLNSATYKRKWRVIRLWLDFACKWLLISSFSSNLLPHCNFVWWSWQFDNWWYIPLSWSLYLMVWKLVVLLFGAKNHLLTLHSLCGYRDRTEWLLSSAVNSSGNVIFAWFHASLQQCKFLQWETWLKRQ